MRYQIIVNPAAGKGTGQVMIPKIRQRLNELRLDFDMVQTEGPWHAARLAHQAACQGYDAVVAAGGDGTLNEVLNGLLQAQTENQKQPLLGMLCVGRGNDFAFGAGIPIDFEAGCQVLAAGHAHPIDIGRIDGEGQPPQGRYFGNGVGIGFDAMVNIQAARLRLRGFLNYLVSVFSTLLFHYHAPLIKIECDDFSVTQPSIMVSVMNGRRMGGGFLMAPEGVNDDGLLDLCIAKQVDRLTILRMVPRFLKGSQAGHPAIRFERGRRVNVTALQGSMPIHADGETLGTSIRQLTIELLPAQIRVLGLNGRTPGR